MESGLAKSVWEIEDLLKLIDRGEVQFSLMKRFRRWLFNAIAGISLLLCITIAAIVVRSWFVFDEFSRRTVSVSTGRNCGDNGIGWDQGRIFLWHYQMNLSPGPTRTAWRHVIIPKRSFRYEFTWWWFEKGGAGPSERSGLWNQFVRLGIAGWPLVLATHNRPPFMGSESGKSAISKRFLQAMRLRSSRHARPVPRMRNDSAEKGNNFKLNR